ncbi:hypothetical protein ACWC5I_00525 [Kitasatospora sp. NPDC001574]
MPESNVDFSKPDAVAFSSEFGDVWWFFKGDQCVEVSESGKTIKKGSIAIGSEDGWPILRGTPFASDLTAVQRADEGWWFFKGDQCLQTNNAGTELKYPQGDITGSDRWPALKEI